MARKMSLLFITFAMLACGAVGGGGRSVPAIYVFGDSLADVGNNNYLPGTSAKANFPHNGIDFEGGVPTGRFSNGYNGIDYLEMLHGVNFASGGSGILDTTGTTITFTAQIMDFKVVTQALLKHTGHQAAPLLLADSVVLISTGSNDIFGHYSQLGPQNTTTNQLFIASLLHKFEDHLTELHKVGARKFGILGLSHIGCVPYLRSQNPSGGCTEELSGMARRFNSAARARLRHLSAALEGMKYSYVNVYDAFSLVLANPRHFGYKELKAACCGSGRFNGGSACTPNATYCPNRGDHLFWDWVHPTQATYKLVARRAYSGSPRVATPINIKQLAAVKL